VTRSKKATKKSPVVIDPYLPTNGNFGYRVSRYELDLEYKVAINRLAGSATITAATLAALRTFTLDLSDALTVTKVSVNGHRPASFRCSGGKLHIALSSPLPAGAAMTIVVRYSGTPRPVRSVWGEVGFEELTEGVLVAGQPNGAASWFPCDDHPSAKASYRIQISTENPYRAIANGELLSRRTRAAMTTWTYELAEPTSTYLVTLQIGMYEAHRLAKTPVPMNSVLPPRLRRNFDHDFGRQPEMMKVFVKLFGPYPLSTGYTVVVTDDDLEIPLEAQGISIFGANHCDGRRSSERLIAHELAHQWFGNSVTARRWRDIWLHEGFACYAEWLWSEESGGRTADEWARHFHQRLSDSPQDLLLSDPGPRDMFDDRVYKRGALTLHALRGVIGDDSFFALLRDWTARHRHATAVTDDFTGLAANYADVSLRPLWDAWLYSKDVPAL
jgi:aminopeptidase N